MGGEGATEATPWNPWQEEEVEERVISHLYGWRTGEVSPINQEAGGRQRGPRIIEGSDLGMAETAAAGSDPWVAETAAAESVAETAAAGSDLGMAETAAAGSVAETAAAGSYLRENALESNGAMGAPLETDTPRTAGWGESTAIVRQRARIFTRHRIRPPFGLPIAGLLDRVGVLDRSLPRPSSLLAVLLVAFIAVMAILMVGGSKKRAHTGIVAHTRVAPPTTTTPPPPAKPNHRPAPAHRPALAAQQQPAMQTVQTITYAPVTPSPPVQSSSEAPPLPGSGSPLGDNPASGTGSNMPGGGGGRVTGGGGGTSSGGDTGNTGSGGSLGGTPGGNSDRGTSADRGGSAVWRSLVP